MTTKKHKPPLGTPIALALAAMSTGSNPILMQEALGQEEVLHTKQRKLPLDISPDRSVWESLGFVFGKKIDNLFQEVTFPDGWSIRPAEDSRWTIFVDDKGRDRGMMFYKAALYDMSAYATLDRRFSITQEYGDRPGDFRQPAPRRVVVKDSLQGVVKTVGPWVTGYTDEHVEALKAQKQKAKNWLELHFPNWQNHTDHWDDNCVVEKPGD